jgi:FMN phosphatase YigB (HAD superfamily)
MKTIFVDMDGVLCDFDKRYKELFERTPSEVRADRERKMYSTYWHEFISKSQFAYLDWHAGGQELVTFLKSLEKVQLCILSSAGGFDRQREVMEQKVRWLRMHDINWPAVIVPGRRFKSGFASNDAFMIDDTPDVITGFIDSGGHGIIHKDATETIERLKQWL